MNQDVRFSIAAVRPLGDRLLLRRLNEQETESRIIVPDVARSKQHRGTVERVGPGKYMKEGWVRPVTVPVGSVVQYQSCDVDDGTHVLIQEADVLFIEN